jgi:uncharacterized protein
MLYRLIFLCLWMPLVAFAEEIPQPLSDTISDFADILPAAEEERIDALIRQTRAETGVHIVVVTMDRIGNYGGSFTRIEDYAKKLFNQWGIGDAKRNDGILILVATEDRAARIALGSAFDAVYDGRAQRVLDTAMLPEFRADRMANGIYEGVVSARDRLAKPFLEGKPITVDEGFPISYTPFLIGFGILAAGATLIFGGRSIWNGYYRCPQCSQPTLSRRKGVVEHATTFSSGSGIRHMTCSSCGYASSENYFIPQKRDRDDRDDSGRGGGGSSSGGGGFGGGSSSGGGATGRW